MSKDFKDYFATKPEAPEHQPKQGDEYLILRSGSVERVLALQAFAYASFEANVAVTVMAVGVWTQINGTLANSLVSNEFTFAANQFTYIGNDQSAPVLVRAHIAGDKDGGGEIRVDLAIFVNGAQHGTYQSSKSADIQAASVEVPIFLTNGDVIEVQIRNPADSSDFIAEHLQLVINR